MSTSGNKRARVVPAPQSVVVTPSNIEHAPYHVTFAQADRMVARGNAVWIPGLKRLREIKHCSVRGERREWRKVSSNGYAVLQLVPPRATTSRAAKLASA
jgi:hypothetical protein